MGQGVIACSFTDQDYQCDLIQFYMHNNGSTILCVNFSELLFASHTLHFSGGTQPRFIAWFIIGIETSVLGGFVFRGRSLIITVGGLLKMAWGRLKKIIEVRE